MRKTEMAKIADIDRGKALCNPEAQFECPAEVIASKMLTRGEKLKALQQWRLGVRNRLDAAYEGMAPPARHEEIISRSKPDPTTRDADLLQQIELSIKLIRLND
jgi:hypothetical protein